MVVERAVFTAIPAGRLPEEGHLKVTVFVTPRLSTGAGVGVEAELGQFEAFANWPRTLTDARFAFDVGGVGQMEGFPLDDPVTPDPDLWEALFGATSVGQAGFQHFEQAVVHSYPVDEVAKAVTGLYQSIAVASPTSFPRITTGELHDQFGRLDPTKLLDRGQGSRRQRIKLALGDLRERHDQPRGRFLRIDAVDPPDRPALSLVAAADFYDRSDDPWDDATATAPPPEPVQPEFHSFVARCADFPELLRRLGLAVDVFIKDDANISEHTHIRVLDGVNGGPLEALLTPGEARPYTRAHRTERYWAPASREEQPDVVDGSLVVDDPRRFLVDQLDPDGAALKVGNLLVSLARTDAELRDSAQRNGGNASMTDDASSLPALRSAGLIVARRDRAAGMVSQFDSSKDHEDNHGMGQPAWLNAADVTRGWRLDILDHSSPTGEWRSLHRRQGPYELAYSDADHRPFPDPQPHPDEGYLKAASMSSTQADPAADQYLHETLIGWDGWSLAAKRPGKIVDETGPTDLPATVARTGFPLAARFRPEPGSLPRLRYGRSYTVRVRAVDLSGRSIPDEQLDEAHERRVDEPYQRWEPVPSPAVVPLTEYTEGESLMRMVIRSTLGVPVTDYVTLQRVKDLPGHQVSGDLGLVYRTENERNLAAPTGSVQLAETHGMFDAALAGDPAAVAAQLTIASRESGTYLTLAGARVVNPRGVPTPIVDGTDSEGQYVVHANRALPLPYLPDPLSRGISLTTLPGDAGTRLIPWPGASADPASWFDRQPVLIRVVEGDATPVFDAGSRTLTVSLPKATIATVKLSSYLDVRDVDLMRVWHLIDQAQNPATATQLDNVRRGRHWMITPAAELTLVHAVEKPLEPPEIRLAGSVRDVDATFSLLPGVIHNHAASTGRLDIDAVWADPVDDPLEARPRDEPKTAHVADFLIQTSEVDAQMWRSNGPPVGPYGPRHEVRHEFGDTRHRWVDYTPTATTRFREYFPPKVTGDRALITSEGATIHVDVPSSARPAPPDVRYLVPIWEWRTEQLEVDAPLAVRRVRTAGGLRVYLGRPWWSSGPDELLGVVLARQPWITWPIDVERGVIGDATSRAMADAWAERVLQQQGAAGGEPAEPPAARFATHVTQAATTLRQERLAALRAQPPGRARGRGEVERFLRTADDAAFRRRVEDVDLSASVVTDVTSGLVSEFLALFTTTGPEGRRYTTAWGADPVFAGDPVPAGPYAHHFPLRAAVGTVRLAELDDTVTVVGHQPQFDEKRRLWYCDVALDTGDAYTPLVQLALARYQPHSVPGMELSPVVKADWAQALPRRGATFVVAPERTAVVVTLAGPVGIPEHASGLPDFASKVRASRTVAAWVEQAPADAGSDLDWTRVGDVVELDVRLGLAALRQGAYREVEWAGAVPLPDPTVLVEGDRLRVRVEEYEVHQADGTWLAPVIVAGLKPRGSRLVYADSVDLP